MLLKGLKALSNFLEFIRFRICIFVTSIGMAGYLLFNPISVNLIFVLLATFLITAGAYAYNNMTDMEEDLVNRKRINPFILSKKSLFLISGLFISGTIFSFFLSLYSLSFCLLGVLISIAYSFFKLKKYFLVKNFYTAFGASLVFLVGAGNISIPIMGYYALFTLFVFIGSSISDLRDYTGDKINNIRTLPVVLGYHLAKKIDFILLGLFSLTILFSDLVVLLPFSLMMIYFLYKNKLTLAHSCEGFSFIFLVIWSVL